MFKEHGFDIIIQYNLNIVHYADVTFHLMTELISLMQNQETKLNTWTKTQTIH